jgi:hypothetical protein
MKSFPIEALTPSLMMKIVKERSTLMTLPRSKSPRRYRKQGDRRPLPAGRRAGSPLQFAVDDLFNQGRARSQQPTSLPASSISSASMTDQTTATKIMSRS